MITCPSCGGTPMPDGHPAGRLAWRHANSCPIRDAEDATQAADRARVRRKGAFTRRATPTEALLLEAQGATVPANLTTQVEPFTTSITRRTWRI